MMTPRAATMPRLNAVPRTHGYPGGQSAIVNPHRGGKIQVPPRGPRHPGGPVVGDRRPHPGCGTRPHWPKRPRPGGPAWVGPAIGIGTGVIIGAIGAAAATPPPPPPPPPTANSGPRGPQGPSGPLATIDIPPQNEQRFVPNEVVLEFAGNFSPASMAALARRHRLVRLDSVNLPSIGSTYFRARIADRRTVRAVLAGLRNERTLRSGQPNYLFTAAQQGAGAPAAFAPLPPLAPPPTPVAAAAASLAATALGDPAQYALSKLRLQEAHGLTRGNNVLVAVIDSGIDAAHPELRGVIAGTFDALDKAERPHAHGTAMAGIIAARSRLMGVAPAARILAIRAFSTSGASAEATTYAILKGIDHALNRNARVINMSFAGPNDPGLARSLATARERGAILVAAAGNLGAKAPPQYPAADPNVIAVTATDAEDRLYAGSVRGGHISVAAPGVDILVPVPGPNYDLTTGTSVAAAHVSGVVALILERKPDLDADAVRRILTGTAKDLGPSGQDEQFGAGLTDAYQAIMSVGPRATAGSGTAPVPESQQR